MRKSKETVRISNPWPGRVMSRLPILPLRNNVLFPGVVTAISLGRKQSMAIVDECNVGDVIGVVSQKNPDDDVVKKGVLYEFGTAAEILRISEAAEGETDIIVRGFDRFRVKKFLQWRPFVEASIERVYTLIRNELKIKAAGRELKKTVMELVHLTPELPREIEGVIQNIKDDEVLADIVAANLEISVEEKQKLLEKDDLYDRINAVYMHALKQLEVSKITHEIHSQAQLEIDKHQREYFLRNQLKAIKDKLGESGEADTEIEDLLKRAESKNLPEEARKVLDAEISRLSKMRDISPEYTMTRTYIDWILDLPWTDYTHDNLELKDVRKILDRDHYNMLKVKDRIIEYLAVRKLKNDMKGPILCLVGPPGVGKTSLGRSVAEAMGRKFVRISLGGVHDEAEIRGHRKTYIGAMPGRVIQGIKKAGSANPVFMLDEIDKLGRDYRGDPSSALLEVLDPEQNFSFQDHYLNLPFDLSKVLFIATANVIETIPAPLRDRTEVIELPGYTLEEKVQIAARHLWPKQIIEHGLSEANCSIEEPVLAEIIDSYTREAGVRNIEREIATICRKLAVKVANGQKSKAAMNVNSKKLEEYLGPPKFVDELKYRVTRSGIATGLAWTPFGGEVIFIEATHMPGKSEITLTGQLGEVMKESAYAAMSYVRAHAARFGINPNFFEKTSVHIHIPSGSIPKDGPSAGIALLAALISLFTEVKVRNDIAMTGEISLRGLVLQVGGIKEKLLAAHRSGIKTVIIPERNKKDLVELPKETLEAMNIVPVNWVHEALEVILEKKLTPLPIMVHDETAPSIKTLPVSS